MKPQRRLALAKEIGNALAKAQLSTLDGSGAATAFGATACRGFKEMGHPGRIFQGSGRIMKDYVERATCTLHARRAEESIYSRLAAPANRSRSVVFSFTAIANRSVTEGL